MCTRFPGTSSHVFAKMSNMPFVVSDGTDYDITDRKRKIRPPRSTEEPRRINVRTIERNPFIEDEFLKSMPPMRPGFTSDERVDPKEANSTEYVQDQIERRKRRDLDPLWQLIKLIAGHAGITADNLIEKEKEPTITTGLAEPTGVAQPGVLQPNAATPAGPSKEDIEKLEATTRNVFTQPNAAMISLQRDLIPKNQMLSFAWMASPLNSGVIILSERTTTCMVSTVSQLCKLELESSSFRGTELVGALSKYAGPTFTLERFVQSKNDTVRNEFAILCAYAISEVKTYTFTRPISAADRLMLSKKTAKSMKFFKTVKWDNTTKDYRIDKVAYREMKTPTHRSMDEIYDSIDNKRARFDT
jgi:hypothetical protein